MLDKFRPIVGRPIPLGRQGEHLARRIVWDDIIEMFQELYGDGTPELRYQRPDDTYGYVPSAIDMTSGLTWRPTATDLAKAGKGRVELRWLVEGKVVKTRTWDCVVESSITEDGKNPDEHDYFDGPYVVTPNWTTQELETDDKICTDDISVLEIPVSEVENEAGGLTLTI